MGSTPANEITQLLQDWSDGDETALEKLVPLVYDELHRLARHFMSRQKPGHTLQTTALIHETFIKLIGQPDRQYQNRAHFFAVAARAMRQILINYARAKHAQKRGAGDRRISLDEALIVTQHNLSELVALDDALKALAAVDGRKCLVVELRYFGGLTLEETADVLKISPATVMRDWGLAKAWLHRELSRE